MGNTCENAKNSNIGGQAVIEGIMMRNRDVYSIAVRKANGQIEVRKEKYNNSDKDLQWRKIPIIRGVYSFISSLVVGMKCLSYSASFFEDDEEEKKKKEELRKLPPSQRKAAEAKQKKQENMMMFTSILIAIVLAVVIFMLVPYYLSDFLGRWVTSKFLLSVFEALIRVVIFIAYLIVVSRLKDIHRTFMYHGAEHKCINCVERGKELNVKNVMESSRFHKRCGTSFLFFVILISIIFFMFIRMDSRLMRLGLRLLLIPVVAGVSFEIISWAGRSNNPFIRILSKPGLAMQRLTTKEPDESMAEVAIAAVEAVFDWKKFLVDEFGIVPDGYFPRLKEDSPMRAWLEAGKAFLEKEGIEEAGTDAWLMFERAARVDLNGYLQKEKEPLPAEAGEKFASMCERRAKHEPVQYITGRAWFYGHSFIVGKGVLIPRMDTEILVEAALKDIEDGMEVLDMCSGTGCILLSLCAERNIKGTGVDISPKAVSTAARNQSVMGLRCRWIISDMFQNISGKYDVIVSNPPYIKSDVIGTLQPEVRDHEPLSALDGGTDGIDFYRKIAAQAPGFLKDGGKLLLEIGYDQADEVTSLLRECGFVNIGVIKDLSGLDRVVRAEKGEQAEK